LGEERIEILHSEVDEDGGAEVGRAAEGLDEAGTGRPAPVELREMGFDLAAGQDEVAAADFGGDLTTAHADVEGENDTNEAKSDDDVNSPEIQEVDRLTSEIDALCGLDTGKTKPRSAGGVSGPELGGGLPQSAGGVSGPELGAGLLTLSAAADSLFGVGVPPPGAGSDERRDALLEVERSLLKQIEELKAAGEPADELLKDMLDVSADLHAFLREYPPRAR
jgi:hypothetical protein